MKRTALIVLFLWCSAVSFGQSADSLKSIIYYQFDRDEFVEVVNYANKAIGYYESEKDLFNMAGCYNILGVAYQRLGQFAEAIDSYNRCCELVEEISKSDPENPIYQRNIRYTKNNIAEIFCSMGEFDQALAMYQSCIESLGEPQDTTQFLDLATYLSNTASVIISKSEKSGLDGEGLQIEDAVEMAEQSLDYSMRFGDLPIKRHIKMMTLAKAYAAVGRNEEAVKIVQEGLAMSETEDDMYSRTGYLLMLGDYQFRQKEYAGAEATYAEAATLARKGRYQENEYMALLGAYQAAKHFDKALALDYYEEHVALKDSIFNEEQQMLLREYQARYELMEKDHQLEIQQEQTKRNHHLVVMFLIVILLLMVIFIFGLVLYSNKKKQNKMLKHGMEIKDNFLSVVSHDVKTSIIAQNMVLDQMYQHCGSMSEEDLKNYLLALKTSSDGMKEKLTNILQWIIGELEVGTPDSHPVRFGLAELVDSCINSQTAEIMAKEIKVVSDIDPQLECNDDMTMVSIVLHNLLSNAVKFSKQKGEVLVTAKDDGDKVWVAVTDHGVGIEAEKLKMLADEIVRPSQGTAGEIGTGLGLLVCRRLLAQTGGKIEIDSVVGESTTVKFSVKK